MNSSEAYAVGPSARPPHEMTIGSDGSIAGSIRVNPGGVAKLVFPNRARGEMKAKERATQFSLNSP